MIKFYMRSLPFALLIIFVPKTCQNTQSCHCYTTTHVIKYLLPPAYVVRREGNSFTLLVCPQGVVSPQGGVSPTGGGQSSQGGVRLVQPGGVRSVQLGGGGQVSPVGGGGSSQSSQGGSGQSSQGGWVSQDRTTE